MQQATGPKKKRAVSTLPSYTLEEETPQQGWRMWLRGRRLVIASSAFAAIIIIALCAKPLYREAKARRALGIATQAGQALDRGDNAEASRLLRQAALMAFQDERVAALVTLQAARAGDAASVKELGEKLSRGSASAEEKLIYGELALRVGDTTKAALASEAIDGSVLPAAQRTRAAVLRGAVLCKEGRMQDAEKHFRAALSADPGQNSDAVRVALAGLLLGGKGREAEAEELLVQASANRGEDGAAALRLLCARRAGAGREALRDFETSAEQLRSHPAAKAEDEIFLARLAAESDQSRTQEIARALVKRLSGSPAATIDTRVAAARWLVSKSCLREVLELVGDEDAAKHAGALMVRLDALSGLEDWEQTSALLEANRGGALPDTLYHLFRARMAAARGDEALSGEEKRQLRQVMAFAELPHVLFVARYAEIVGWKPEALAAWRILAADEGARSEAIRGQLRNLPPDAPAAEGKELAGQLLALQPKDPSARISLAYFQLLSGENADVAAKVAEEFLAAEPESVDMRRVAALGRLRTGQAGRGLDIWPGDNGEGRWRALHVALLRGAGREREAQRASAQIDENSLGPEEKELLSQRTSSSPH